MRGGSEINGERLREESDESFEEGLSPPRRVPSRVKLATRGARRILC